MSVSVWQGAGENTEAAGGIEAPAGGGGEAIDSRTEDKPRGWKKERGVEEVLSGGQPGMCLYPNTCLWTVQYESKDMHSPIHGLSSQSIILTSISFLLSLQSTDTLKTLSTASRESILDSKGQRRSKKGA